jgi:ubiquitin C-terminal hydrolase
MSDPITPQKMEPPPQPSRDPALKGVVGLMNLGNTCYANSTIQIIRAVPELSAMIVSDDLELKIVNKDSKPAKILLAYQDLIRPMWSSYKPAYVRPMGFISEIRECVKGTVYDNFGMPMQNDSHEYLVYLLDNFHEAMNKHAGKSKLTDASSSSVSTGMNDRANEGWREFIEHNNSPLVDYCFGMVRQTTECQSCNNRSHQWQPFNVFKIPCEGKSMQDWFTNELKDEEIEDYDCVKCRPTRQKATLSRKIWQLPHILFTGLRRFTPDMRKIMKPCPYDGQEINFRKHFASESNHPSRYWTYELRGVVDHHGSHMGGHYSSQFCHPLTQEWWWIDDESTMKMEKPRLQNGSNYIYLFRAKPSTELADLEAKEA